jgi:hypothetical protein
MKPKTEPSNTTPEHAESVSTQQMPDNATATNGAAPDAETLALTAGEVRMLRRIALQIKSRCEKVWSNRATIGRLPMLAELTHIKAGADLFYAILTDATWRELTETQMTEAKKV